VGGFLLPKLLVFCNDFCAIIMNFGVNVEVLMLLKTFGKNWSMNNGKLNQRRSHMAECMRAV